MWVKKHSLIILNWGLPVNTAKQLFRNLIQLGVQDLGCQPPKTISKIQMNYKTLFSDQPISSAKQSSHQLKAVVLPQTMHILMVKDGIQIEFWRVTTTDLSTETDSMQSWIFIGIHSPPRTGNYTKKNGTTNTIDYSSHL